MQPIGLSLNTGVTAKRRQMHDADITTAGLGLKCHVQSSIWPNNVNNKLVIARGT